MFDKNAGAEPVEWLKFLAQVFRVDHDDGTVGVDQEFIDTLQEIMGYLLSYDTSLQKFFMLVGPKRSGKGTILRVMQLLVGPANYTSATLQQLVMGSGFGLQTLIDKTLCLFPDATLSGRTDAVAIAEVIKSITGEDTINVGRKFKEAWIGQSLTRFVIAANEVLSLQDRSG